MKISRVKRSRESARVSYNRLSRWYDVISGNTEKKYRNWGLEKFSTQPGEKILEIGFGTGHCLVSLAKAVGATGHVMGVDISDGMLAIARERLQKEGLGDRVELHLGDATQLDFIQEESLDGVFMSFTLELFDTPEIPRVLQECFRILKHGGRLAVVSMTKTDPPGMAVRIYEWFHEHLPDYADCRPIFARRSMEQNGFVIQDINIASMWGLPVEIVLGRKV
jgi:demethylmenaquinone methyltransferase/2-methoxy-6-polyprenyl-1,4-benzoquinol methylase